MNIARIAYYVSRLTSQSSRLLVPLVFLASLALYTRTTCPTLGGGWDSEEFQHVAYTLGVAHSTGYPLYLLLGKTFTTLVPIGNVAYRMNVLSAILTALAVVFVYLTARLLTQRQLAPVATAALFATNVAVWRQAGVASVGPLNLLLLSALVYTLLLWHARRAPLAIAAFIFGLGLAHHRTILFIAPAIAIFVWLSDPRIVRRPREWVCALFWLALPLALYLYLPIFGSAPPWYINSLEGFLNHIAGSEAGNYTRSHWLELGQAFSAILQYLFDSFSIIGIALIGIGAASLLPRFNRVQTHLLDARAALFLGLSALTYIAFATLVSGEPDRYLVLPFAFLLYWFAFGVDAIEDYLTTMGKSSRLSPYVTKLRTSFRLTLALVLALLIALPLPTRLRAADWSTFDRVYKTWDEIFTLPIPPHATIVGNWGQLNAMRYMQRVENRRTDLQLVGTLYDATPQTDAARAAFADSRAIFLAPGVALPLGEYRYAQLGPLLEVRDAPQTESPTASKNIAINSALTLAHYEITTALEPYAPTTHIAPNRTARVTLVWRAEDHLADFLLRVRVYDIEGYTIVLKDESPVRGLYPPSRWSPGEYVRSVHNILIPAGTPPGEYRLTVQITEAQSQMPISDEIALASFDVTRATNLTRDQVFVAHPLTLALNDSIELWGYGGFEGTRRAGETLGGNLVFFVRRQVDMDYTLTFALRNVEGNIVQTWMRAPVAFYPTREWQSGEILKAYYSLQLASDLSAGTYTLAIGLNLNTLHNLAPVQVVR